MYTRYRPVQEGGDGEKREKEDSGTRRDRGATAGPLLGGGARGGRTRLIEHLDWTC